MRNKIEYLLVCPACDNTQVRTQERIQITRLVSPTCCSKCGIQNKDLQASHWLVFKVTSAWKGPRLGMNPRGWFSHWEETNREELFFLGNAQR